MKRIIFAMLACALLFSGCARPGSNTQDIGANAAWMAVSMKKMGVAQAVAEAEARKAEAEKSAQPVIEIKSADAMREYAALKRDETMLKVIESNADAMKTMARALTGEQEKGLLDVPPQPKDKWAQRIDSAGDAGQKIAGTPAVLAGTVAGAVSRAAGDKFIASDGGVNAGNGVRQASRRDLVSGQNPAITPTVDRADEDHVITTLNPQPEVQEVIQPEPLPLE